MAHRIKHPEFRDWCHAAFLNYTNATTRDKPFEFSFYHATIQSVEVGTFDGQLAQLGTDAQTLRTAKRCAQNLQNKFASVLHENEAFVEQFNDALVHKLPNQAAVVNRFRLAMVAKFLFPFLPPTPPKVAANVKNRSQSESQAEAEVRRHQSMSSRHENRRRSRSSSPTNLGSHLERRQLLSPPRLPSGRCLGESQRTYQPDPFPNQSAQLQNPGRHVQVQFDSPEAGNGRHRRSSSPLSPGRSLPEQSQRTLQSNRFGIRSPPSQDQGRYRQQSRIPVLAQNLQHQHRPVPNLRSPGRPFATSQLQQRTVRQNRSPSEDSYVTARDRSLSPSSFRPQHDRSRQSPLTTSGVSRQDWTSGAGNDRSRQFPPNASPAAQQDRTGAAGHNRSRQFPTTSSSTAEQHWTAAAPRHHDSDQRPRGGHQHRYENCLVVPMNFVEGQEFNAASMFSGVATNWQYRPNH